MLVHLILALAATALVIYAFIYSPPAVRFGDVLFYDPLEDSIRRYGGNEE